MTLERIDTDIAIIGAGMAGASLAAEIGRRARVLLIEAEAQPGYHATGRSAAFWSETYGGPAVQPLTSASGPWLERGGYLHPRGAMHVARAGEEHLLDAMLDDFRGSGVLLQHVDPEALAVRVPGLRGIVRGVAEPSCCDIDVGGLHAAVLTQARRSEAVIRADARVQSLQRRSAGWQIMAGDLAVTAAIVVNAAGAWASAIARMAGASRIAVQPYRRTMVQLRVDPPAPAGLPLVVGAAGDFYFKPEAGGRLWLSPHDETACDPCDAAPEEIDVAVAIDRLQGVVDWRIEARERAWAGLRSFAPDRAPVYGFDAAAPGFFWFAGQGGFGIQTAPAAAMIGAALLLGEALPEAVAAIDVDRYAPDRFRR